MIDNNQLALLELLKASLFKAQPSFPEGVDWSAVLDEATAQTVIALAAPAVPADHAADWRVPTAQNTARFLRMLYEQSNLSGIFSGAGIPPVVLKGTSAAMYYPEPMRRSMGDIDIITLPDRFEDARGLLEENGYEFTGDYGDDRDYSYAKDGVVVELHHRYSDADWDIEPLIIEGINNAVTREVCGKSFLSLPDAVNGLVLLDHVRHHLYGGLGLRQIIDWMMYVHAMSGDGEWEREFMPLIRTAGLEKLACVMTKMCKIWFGLPDEAEWCDAADEESALMLLENVLRVGNFGVKDRYVYRPMQSVTMSVKQDGLFPTLQKAGLANWQAAQRHAALRPFAWLYQSFRFAGRGAAALFRGADFKKDISDGAERLDFHQRMGIDIKHDTSEDADTR